MPVSVVEVVGGVDGDEFHYLLIRPFYHVTFYLISFASKIFVLLIQTPKRLKVK